MKLLLHNVLSTRTIITNPLYESVHRGVLLEHKSLLTESEYKYVCGFDEGASPILKEYLLLMEQNLSQGQIQSLFKAAEEAATSEGNNQNILGKIAQGAALPIKKIAELNSKMDKFVLGKLDSSQPVQNFDSAFAKAQNQLLQKFPNIKQKLDSYFQFAKKHPVAQGFILAAVIFGASHLLAAAGVAGATSVAGTALIGFLTRTMDGALRGEKMSHLIYKGAKSAALSGLGRLAIHQIAEFAKGITIKMQTPNLGRVPNHGAVLLSMDLDSTNPAMKPYMEQIRADGIDHYLVDDKTAQMANAKFQAIQQKVTAAMENNDPKALQEVAKDFHSLSEQLKTREEAFRSVMRHVPGQATLDAYEKANPHKFMPNYKGVAYSHDMTISTENEVRNAVRDIGQNANSARTFRDAIIVQNEFRHELQAAAIDELAKKCDAIGDVIGQAAQAKIAAGSAGQGQQQQGQQQGQQGQQQLDEVDWKGMWNKAKGAVGKVGQAIGNAAGQVKQAAGEATKKVTAKKLTAAWQQAGSPMDVQSVVKILTDAGITQSQLKKIADGAGVDLGVSNQPDTDASGQVQAQKTPEQQKSTELAKQAKQQEQQPQQQQPQTPQGQQQQPQQQQQPGQPQQQQQGQAQQQQAATYKKVQDLAANFTKEFSAAFKKMAGNNEKLLSYADQLSGVVLKEMMANPAQGMKDKEAAAAKAKKPKKAKAAPKAAPEEPAQGQQGQQGQKPQQPAQGGEPQQGQQGQQEAANYKQLTKVFKDFLANVGQTLQIKGTSREFVKQLQQSQALSDDQKEKLSTFVKVHLKIVKTLGDKLKAKSQPKQDAKPDQQSQPQQQPQQQGGEDYSIEESKYKSYFKTLLR